MNLSKNNIKVLKEKNSFSEVKNNEKGQKIQKENLFLEVIDNLLKKEEKIKKNKESLKKKARAKSAGLKSSRDNISKNSKNLNQKPLIIQKKENKNDKDIYYLLKKGSAKDNNKNKSCPCLKSNIILNKFKLKFEEEKNNSKFVELKKCKKVYNIKKKKISIISFVDKKNNCKKFPLYKDSEIGFGKDYSKVKHFFQDNDVESDDESVRRGYNTSFLNISYALKLMKNKNEEYVGKYLKRIKK